MDLEKKQKENQEYASNVRAVILLLVVLFISSVVHSSVLLSLSNEKNYAVRAGFVAMAVIIFPIYWLIYLATYMAGGFKD